MELLLHAQIQFSVGHKLSGKNFSITKSKTSMVYPCMCRVKKEEDPKSRNRMFVLGMGFVGQFFAQDLKNQGWVVSGTCKSAMKKKQLEEKGFDAYVFDANEPRLEILNALKSYTHLLVSIPPVAGVGDQMLRHGDLLRRTLMDGSLQWLCYLSSTSVYGQCDGAWVDENYPPNPTTEIAKLRLVAEEKWLNLADNLGISGQVFRLGGIYGPGRSAVDTLIKQEPLSAGQQMRESRKYTSRVHVEDICQSLNASICRSPSRKIYNIVDDDPAPREEVFACAQDLIEKKWKVKLRQCTSSKRAESVVLKRVTRGEKRVSNACMKKELEVRLLHPSFRSGLQSIINQMENPFSL